jgi:hypothetical protein
MTGESNAGRDVSVLAYLDGERSADQVRRTARTLAREHRARLILYEAAEASPLIDPIAGPVATEGEGDRFGNPLSPEELAVLGHRALAEEILVARGEGIDAWGWLATSGGVEPFMEYAREQGAAVVVLPAGLDDSGLFEHLHDERIERGAGREPASIVTVDHEGNFVSPL